MVLLIAMYRRVAIPAVTTKPINDGVYRDVKIRNSHKSINHNFYQLKLKIYDLPIDLKNYE